MLFSPQILARSRNAVVTAAWSPLSLTGLLGWYKADGGLFSDAGSTPAVNNGNIAQWNDFSGANRHLSKVVAQPGPTYRSTGLNGHATVDFTVGDTCLMSATSFAAGTGTAMSIFAALAVDATNNNSTGRIIGYAPAAGAVTDGIAFVMHSSSTALDGWVDGNAWINASVTLTDAVLARVGFVWNATNPTKVYLNGTPTTGDSPASFSLSNNGIFAVGAETSGGSAFVGKMSEVIVTNTAITGGDLTSLDTYLQRWA